MHKHSLPLPPLLCLPALVQLLCFAAAPAHSSFQPALGRPPKFAKPAQGGPPTGPPETERAGIHIQPAEFPCPASNPSCQAGASEEPGHPRKPFTLVSSISSWTLASWLLNHILLRARPSNGSNAATSWEHRRGPQCPQGHSSDPMASWWARRRRVTLSRDLSSLTSAGTDLLQWSQRRRRHLRERGGSQAGRLQRRHQKGKGRWKAGAHQRRASAAELMRCDREQMLPYHLKAMAEKPQPPTAGAAAEAAAALLRQRQFWMLAHTTEQLTKGLLHLVEAARLAATFNRTLVLPQVRSSNLRAFERHRLCLYLDVTSLSALGDWVTFDFFAHALRHSRPPPCAAHVMLAHAGMRCPRGPAARNPHSPELVLAPTWRDWPRELSKPLDGSLAAFRAHCFRASSTAGENDALGMNKSSNGSRDAQRLRKFFAGEVLAAPAPLLVAEYKYSSGFFLPRAEIQSLRDSIRFAPHLHRAAGRFVQSQWQGQGQGQQLFIAVHWRSEWILEKRRGSGRGDGAEHLFRCARGLIGTVKGLLKPPSNFSWAFVASDVTAAGRPSSRTFARMRTKEIRAARAARKLIETELRPKAWTSGWAGYPSVDSGVQGILDMLVCAQADLFVHAPPECGGASSSFMGQIMRLRSNATLGGAASMAWS